MKKLLSNLFRCLVGSKCGFFGEGNLQWYYTLALAISVIIAWLKLPQTSAITFTVISILHLVSLHLYALSDKDPSQDRSIGYLVFHAVLLIVAMFTNWKFSLISILLMFLFLTIAPDEAGYNFLVNKFFYDKFGKNINKLNSWLAYISHTIVFSAFVIAVFQLPVLLWIKLTIIVAMLLLHPLIDYLAGECVDVVDIADEIINELFGK